MTNILFANSEDNFLILFSTTFSKPGQDTLALPRVFVCKGGQRDIILIQYFNLLLMILI